MRPSSREPNGGSRPARLKIKKESHSIHKSSSSSAAAASIDQRAAPVIIYTHAPRIIHTEARHFMALVQKLTGMSGGPDDPDDDSAATTGASPALHAPMSASTTTTTAADAGVGLVDRDSYDMDVLGFQHQCSTSSICSNSLSPPPDASSPPDHTFPASATSPEPRMPDININSVIKQDVPMDLFFPVSPSCLMYQEMPPAAAAATLTGGWINPSFGYGNQEDLF